MRVQLLGGVGRFGKNCALVEHRGFRLGIDCGVAFSAGGPPELPDLSVARTADAWVITHAHEDHGGALSFVPRKPVLCTEFTRRLMERRGRALAPWKSGPFSVKLVPVPHSVPGSAAVIVEAEGRSLVFSGDFRLAERPLVGDEFDLDAFGRPLAFFCDSTGADVHGENVGERAVIEPLVREAGAIDGRVFVVSFASHVERVAVLAEVCRKLKRRLFVFGRALHGAVELAREMKLIDIDDVFSPVSMFKSFPRERSLVVLSGTQAERGSAALQLAFGEHRRLKLSHGDGFVHSARVIPGHETRVDEMCAAAASRGARIVRAGDVHISGHAYARDLSLVHTALNCPVVPVHGDEAMLEAHAVLVEEGGLLPVRARDGSVLRFLGDDIDVDEARLRRFVVREGRAVETAEC